MALQYLDAETIPYFVVLRSSGGGYQGSWSSAYSMKYQGDYAVLIGHNNAEMGLKVKFDEMDWGACLPVPDPIPTDTEGYMAYLSTIFTGQAIAPTPPTTTMSPIISNPTSLDLGVDGTYTATLVGIADIVAVQSENIGSIGACTIKKWVLTIGNNNADDVVKANIFKISSLGAKKIIATIPIRVGVVGIEVVEAIDTTILSDDLIGIEYIVLLGTGNVSIASSCVFVEIPA